MFSKGDQQLWFKIKALCDKNATECCQRLLVACRGNALPCSTIPLIVKCNWEGGILGHAVTTGANCQRRLLLLISTTPSTSGYVMQTPTFISKQSIVLHGNTYCHVANNVLSYCDGCSGKPLNILLIHLT